MRHSRLTLSVLALSGAIIALNTQNARAGFLWQPPSQEESGAVIMHDDEELNGLPTIEAEPTTAAVPLPEVNRAPEPSNGERPVSLAPQENAQMKSRMIGQSDAPVAPAQKYRSAQPRDPEPQSKIGRPAISLQARLPENEMKLAPVYGFGSDLPFALALKQVVPPSFGYVLEDGMDMGMRVSWNGNGQPWSEVLRDMVRPLGMDVAVFDGKVYIKSPENLPSSVRNVDTVRATRIDTLATPITQKAKMVASPPKIGVIHPNPLQNSDVEAHNNSSPQRLNITDPGRTQNYQPRITSPKAPAVNWNSPSRTGQETEANAAPVKIASVAPQPLAPLAPQNETILDNTVWEAQKGESLRKVLLGWGQREGIALIWQAPEDYIVNSNIIVTGNITNALDILMTYGLGESAPDLSYEIRQSGGAPAVLLVQG